MVQETFRDGAPGWARRPLTHGTNTSHPPHPRTRRRPQHPPPPPGEPHAPPDPPPGPRKPDHRKNPVGPDAGGRFPGAL